MRMPAFAEPCEGQQFGYLWMGDALGSTLLAMRQRLLMITVVDDDTSVRRALQRLLRSAGLTVKTFATAQEFLDSGDVEQTACLVLDIHLPGMTGFDLQKHLADSGVIIPIVFITAHDNYLSQERARMTSAAYLRKPFDEQVLIAAIGRATGRDVSGDGDT
jgi:FixJ family two-component response regulator